LLNHHPLIFGKESLVSGAAVLVAPFVLLWVMTRLFPPWHDGTSSRSALASGP